MRDTWKITPGLVTLDGPTWEATPGAVLDDVRDELRLLPTTKRRAELHAMLVYGKGQFFLPHQDSEKDDAMVGTLVVSLPSAHTGGPGRRARRRERHVPDVEGAAVFRGLLRRLPSRGQAREVRAPVTLTLNLPGDSTTGARGAGPVADLAHCLTEHFTTPAMRRYGRTGLDPPNRLVYLLDH